MTPPVQQHALDASAQHVVLPRWSEGLYTRFRTGHLVTMVDVWVLLALLWASRVVTGTLDPGVALFGCAVMALLVSPRVQHERLNLSALNEAGTILRRTCFAYAGASAVGLVLQVGQPRSLLFIAGLTAPAFVAGRGLSYRVDRALRRRITKARTLIVGGGEIARRVVATLEAHKEYGLQVIGAVDDDPKFEASELGTRLLGSISSVPDLVASHEVEVVIVAFSSGNQANLVEIIRGAQASGATVWMVPRFFELGSTSTAQDHLWGLPVVRLQPPARSRPEWLLKRALDFVIAAVGLAFLSPVLALIALLTRLEVGRPVLLRQTRVGIDGQPFQLFKFRTMALVDKSVEGTEWTPDEARIGRTGRFLRDTGLDELPQLFNVLRGDMSLVGPRPERPYFVNLFSELYPQYDSRHRLPAGVTGWAQVHGLRGDTSIEERAVFDNYYIENWSLSQDMKILLRTVGTFARK